MTVDLKANLAAMGYGSQADIEAALQGLGRLLPAACLLSAGAVLGLNAAVARRLLAATGQSLPVWPSFRVWHAPEHVVWALIAGGLLVVPADWPLRLIGLNLLALMTVIYFVQGLAIAAFFLEKRRVPRPLRLVIYVLLALQQYASLAVAVVGLLDLWIDFRRLREAAVEEAES